MEKMHPMKIVMLSLPLLLFAEASEAATCKDLKTCANVMFELKGQRYMWEADSDKKIVTSPELELTPINAEIVFTAMLDQAGLARMPVGDGKTYRILRGAHLKELEMPIVEASAEVEPKLPETWDWVVMRYKTKVPELTETIESAYRLHVPRESRLQADYNAGFIIVTAAAPVVRQMYKTIKAADVPETSASKAHRKEREKKWEAQRAKDSKN